MKKYESFCASLKNMKEIFDYLFSLSRKLMQTGCDIEKVIVRRVTSLLK